MGLFGKILGRALGSVAGNIIPQLKGIDTGGLGETVGGLAPFKKGGRVKKTGPIYAHKGEYVLRKGIAPTKSQKERTEKGKKGKKGGKGGKGGKGKK